MQRLTTYSSSVARLSLQIVRMVNYMKYTVSLTPSRISTPFYYFSFSTIIQAPTSHKRLLFLSELQFENLLQPSYSLDLFSIAYTFSAILTISWSKDKKETKVRIREANFLFSARWFNRVLKSCDLNSTHFPAS